MATIQIQAWKVEEAAQLLIERINLEHERKDRESIREATEKLCFSFKRGFYHMNQEEALVYLLKTDDYFPSCERWGISERVQGLLLLAKHGDPVTLNADDVQILFGNT